MGDSSFFNATLPPPLQSSPRSNVGENRKKIESCSNCVSLSMVIWQVHQSPLKLTVQDFTFISEQTGVRTYVRVYVTLCVFMMGWDERGVKTLYAFCVGFRELIELFRYMQKLLCCQNIFSFSFCTIYPGNSILFKSRFLQKLKISRQL